MSIFTVSILYCNKTVACMRVVLYYCSRHLWVLKRLNKKRPHLRDWSFFSAWALLFGGTGKYLSAHQKTPHRLSPWGVFYNRYVGLTVNQNCRRFWLVEYWDLHVGHLFVFRFLPLSIGVKAPKSNSFFSTMPWDLEREKLPFRRAGLGFTILVKRKETPFRKSLL